MKVSMRLCGVAIATLLLPACATVTRGTKEKFVIESSPSDADVALSTGITCKTPCRLKLKRKHAFTATFTKDGYETLEASVDSETKGGGIAAGAGNILVGGIVGGILDGSNGSMKDLTPNPLKVTLKPVAAAAMQDAVAADAAPAAEPAAPAEAAAETPPAEVPTPDGE